MPNGGTWIDGCNARARSFACDVCVCKSVEIKSCFRFSDANQAARTPIRVHSYCYGWLCAVSQWQSGRLVYTKNGLWTDKRNSTYAYVCQFYWHGTDGRVKWKSDADAARAFTAISLFAVVSCVFLPSCRSSMKTMAMNVHVWSCIFGIRRFLRTQARALSDTGYVDVHCFTSEILFVVCCRPIAVCVHDDSGERWHYDKRRCFIVTRCRHVWVWGVRRRAPTASSVQNEAYILHT